MSENRHLMPDFAADNKPVTIGQALTELKEMGVPASRIRFHLFEPSPEEESLYSNKGEITSQTPAAHTSLENADEIVLYVNHKSIPEVDFHSIIADLFRRISFDDTRVEALSEFLLLLQELQKNFDGAGDFDANWPTHYNMLFEESRYSQHIYSILEDRFEPYLQVSRGGEIAVEEANLWVRNYYRQAQHIFSNSDFLSFLNEFYSAGIALNYQERLRKFAFLDAPEYQESFNEQPVGVRNKLKKYFDELLYVYAELDVYEEIDHAMLLDKTIQAVVHEACKAIGIAEGKSTKYIEEILTEGKRYHLHSELTRQSQYPFLVKRYVLLLQRLFPQMDPETISATRRIDALVVSMPGDRTNNDEILLRLVEYLFLPLTLEVQYTDGGNAGLVLGTSGVDELGKMLLH